VLELGVLNAKVVDVPVIPVCGLDPDETVTFAVSDAQLELEPL
jgi:hypothetical protein